MHIGTSLNMLNDLIDIGKLGPRSVMVPCTFTVLAVTWWNFIFRCVVILFFQNKQKKLKLSTFRILLHRSLCSSEKQLKFFSSAYIDIFFFWRSPAP